DSSKGYQVAYTTALNKVTSKCLLPKEKQILVCITQTQAYHSPSPAAPPSPSPPGTLSTMLTNINLKQHVGQIPRHTTKIINLWNKEVSKGKVIDCSSRTHYGTHSGKQARHKESIIILPLLPKPMPDRYALPSDISNIASIAFITSPPYPSNSLILLPLTPTRHNPLSSVTASPAPEAAYV
ncbi:hypothetical protein LY76DRAFT_529602, partial [Colletotrichum caudatum]